MTVIRFKGNKCCYHLKLKSSGPPLPILKSEALTVKSCFVLDGTKSQQISIPSEAIKAGFNSCSQLNFFTAEVVKI